MARWHVDYIGKGGKHLGTVETGREECQFGGLQDVPHHAR
jgi:hypothetical protein